ncbi:MAG: hypothetical protein JSW48_05665 [Betaproteobacteria bacterium]|nr:MAG: hypothetical protein JSW48_05665 [Betaproteobacteria bacterium]
MKTVHSSNLKIGLIASLVASRALATDTSKPFPCASIQVHECTDGRKCEVVLPDDFNVPTFMRVNVKNKQIGVLKDAPPTRIRSVSRIEDRLILQDAEDGKPRQPDVAGWTLSIENETGRFGAPATVIQGAVVMFSACAEL